jgi:hypothetical protein
MEFVTAGRIGDAEEVNSIEEEEVDSVHVPPSGRV